MLFPEGSTPDLEWAVFRKQRESSYKGSGLLPRLALVRSGANIHL